jgi:hypothetical protein
MNHHISPIIMNGPDRGWFCVTDDHGAAFVAVAKAAMAD